MKVTMIHSTPNPNLLAETTKGWLNISQYLLDTQGISQFSLESLFKEENLTKVENLINQSLNQIPNTYFLAELDNQVSAPLVRQPSKILAVGLNYKNHIAEMKMDKPKVPEIFNKLSNTLNTHKQPILVPNTDLEYDYEGELVIVIGKTIKNVSPQEAEEAILGYTIGNDFTSRKLQFVTSQWLLGKSMDGFAPVGPYLVTKDQFNLETATITTEVNQQTVQQAPLSDMIYPPKAIVSYLSRYLTLEAGDLIFTGTPNGVILGDNPNQLDWLKDGDTVTVTISGIGQLENTIRYENEPD